MFNSVRQILFTYQLKQVIFIFYLKVDFLFTFITRTFTYIIFSFYLNQIE